jgi:adenosylmethionine-8-amino-7-oxononanoate aminotransferase
MEPPMSILLPYTYESPADLRIYSSGRGVYLYTNDGRQVLDGLAGSMNANLGHGNVAVAAAMHEQALGLTSLPSIAGDVSEASIELADRLTRILGVPNSACVFTSSGSEATETALAAVWKYWSHMGRPGKYKILSLDGSYHGCTLGALALTGREEEHADVPLTAPNFRLPLPAWNPSDASRVSRSLEKALASEVPGQIAAIFLEPVMGLAGMIPAPERDIRRVVEICRANDILVVLDEALTGLGRAGDVTAARLYGIEPDVLLVSKGLGCGFVSIAATCLSTRIASVLQHATPTLRHGHTASGNPLAARVACTVLDELDARSACANAALMGDTFRHQMSAVLPALRREYTLRAVGLCMAIETDDAAFAQEVRRGAYLLGLRIRAIDRNIIVCPPLIINPHEITQLIDILSRALAAAEECHSAGGFQE